jgi:enolase
MDALKIDALRGWEALDSRGRPTVACAVQLVGGATGKALAPSGASVGNHEAFERRDGGERLGGSGVYGSIASIQGEIASALSGLDASDQQQIDRTLRALDGTHDLTRLGANTVVAVSLACAIAAAAGWNIPLWRLISGENEPLLPLPMGNIMSGGAHANDLIDFQDILAVPVGAETFRDAIDLIVRTRAGTAAVLQRKGFDTHLVADEGGLAASLNSNFEALEVVADGIDAAGLELGTDVALAIDVAATRLHDGHFYQLRSERRTLSGRQLMDELRGLTTKFPIVSIEDPAADDDVEGWALATAELSGLQILGDDLFATNVKRFEDGLRRGLANAVLVKPNQIGTLTDAQNVLRSAQAASYATVVSARSGDTEDAWLADIAVGWRSGQIKVGSTTRSERTAKWNRLLQIEAENPKSQFAGRDVLAPL